MPSGGSSPTFSGRRAAAHHTAATTYTITGMSGITAGNLLILALAINGGAVGVILSTVTDNGAGSAWNRDASLSTTNSQTGIAIWSTIVGATPPTSITVTLSGALPLATSYMVAEFTAIDQSQMAMEVESNELVEENFPCILHYC